MYLCIDLMDGIWLYFFRLESDNVLDMQQKAIDRIETIE